MGDYDEPPPLEDMTSFLEDKKKKSFNSVTNSKESGEKTGELKKDTKSGLFCGMAKGFLLGGENKNSKSSSSEASLVPAVKEPPNNSFVFEEVQTAMKEENAGKDWVTDELLHDVASNSELCDSLNNAKFQEILTEFQVDPAKAYARYHNNPEVMKKFQSFCGILGNHMEKLDNRKVDEPETFLQEISSRKIDETASAEVCVEVQNILENDELRHILQDSEIVKFLDMLRKDSIKAGMYLDKASDKFRSSVHKLVSAGLLAVG